MSQPSLPTTSENVPPPVKLTKAQKKELYTKSYPEPLDTRRKVLKEIFLNEKDELLKNELLTTVIYQILEDAENPLSSLMELYNATTDRSKETAKHSLAGAILKIALNWFKKRDESVEQLREKFLSRADKEEAFKSIVKVHALHLDYVNELYNFDSEDFENFIIQHIEFTVHRCAEFKLAMDIASVFKLYNHFPCDLFVLPCYLLGQHDPAKEFLLRGQCIDHQKLLIRFFDDFIDQQDDYVHDRLNKYTDQRILKMSREIFFGKTLLKRVKDLVKCFAMEKEQRFLAPRLMFHCSLQDMLYNARRRFADQVINDACYFQLLKDELKSASNELKKAFIGKLFRLGGNEYKDDAVRWVVYLGLLDDQLHQDVVEYKQNNRQAVQRAHGSIVVCEQQEDVNNLLLLDRYPIIWVSNTRGVKELIEEFSKGGIIALDSEWKQKSGSMCADQIALLQIYLSEKVYLVDFISLEQQLRAEDWKSFLGALLTGPSIKLGFDLLNDVRAMFAGEHTSPLKYLEEETNNVVCLKNLVHNILMLDSEFVTFDRKATRADSDLNVTDGEPTVIHFKLSDLSEKVAGRALDKSEQCSNWAARPLRMAQMTYAAMDAYIVYEIYERLYEQAGDSQVRSNWEDLLKQSIWNASRKDKVKKKNDKKLGNMNWTEIIESFSQPALGKYDAPKKPGEVKLLIDSHLKGLGKNLRRLGVDVLWPLRDGESVIRMATKLSDRTILTSATMKKVNELKSRFSARVIYLGVVNDINLIDLTKSVIRQLNIQLSTEAVFSRCMDCNAAKFIKAPRPVMQALYESTVLIPNDDGDYPFNLYAWLEHLRKVDERDYAGIGCEVQVHPDYPDFVNIVCHDGSIDIVKNLAMHHTDISPVDTLIKKVDKDIIKKSTIPFYYICGGCGKIYWDGSHGVNFNKHVETHMPEYISQGEQVDATTS